MNKFAPSVQMKASLLLVFLGQLLTGVGAIITADGIWTGADWNYVDPNGTFKDFYIVDGIAYFDDETWVYPAELLEAEFVGDIYDQESVLRVLEVFTEDDWETLFPNRLAGATFECFLSAVARFPYFCTMVNFGAATNLDTIQSGCKRQLAALLAHLVYETSEKTLSDPDQRLATGFTFFNDQDCLDEALNPPSCFYSEITTGVGKEFPASASGQYFGRGASFLRWNGKYGQFSKAYFEKDFHGDQVLLKEPWLVQSFNPELIFVSALWYFMTPHYPMPSAHNVINGYFEPNSVDISQGAGNNFGTTIPIMAQDSANKVITAECFTGSSLETEQAQMRVDIFSRLISHFGLAAETTDSMGCKDKRLDYNGAGDVPSFWFAGSSSNECKPVSYETKYSIYNEDDYKRCVCWFWGDGEQDCPQDDTWEVCSWSEVSPRLTELIIPVFTMGDTVELTAAEIAALGGVLDPAQFPVCQSSLTSAELTPDYAVIELHRDNNNLKATSKAFRIQNKNDQDSSLGLGAPVGMRIAKQLGQTTVVIDQTNPILNFDVLDNTFFGSWLFDLHVCVDFSGTLDCDVARNRIQVRVVDCNTAFGQTFPECDTGGGSTVDPIVPIDPVTPEPEETDGDETEEPGTDEDPEVVEEDEVTEPADFDDNQAPYFLDFEEFNLFGVVQNATLTVEVPQPLDDDQFDIVLVSATLSAEESEWIVFDWERREFVLSPTDSTEPGTYPIQVILDDSKDTAEYFFNFQVLSLLEPDQEVPSAGDGEGSQDGALPEDTDNQETQEGEEGDPDSDPVVDGSKSSANDASESGFDPESLWSKDNVYKQIKEERQRLPVLPETKQNVMPPKSIIFAINEIGEVSLKFSQMMYLDVLFGAFEFTSDVQQVEQGQGRRLSAAGSKVNLSDLLQVEIEMGDEETSASQEKLGFTFELMDYLDQSIELKVRFEYPLSLSIGAAPDILSITFVEPDLFVSKETGKSLSEESQTIKREVPKQFPSEASYALGIVAGSTVQVAANTAFLSQLGVTLCLAASLKAMWNLMHVMQVLAYFRLMISWPANSHMMLQSMHNAITLDNLLNGLYDGFFDEIQESMELDDARETSEELELKRYDISYKNIGLSLGIFGIFLGMLIVAVLIYFLIKLISVKFRFCNTIRKLIGKKLFFNVWIRYMIESNLKTTHNCIFFLYIAGGFDSFEDKLSTWMRIILISIFVIWPFFLTIFLYFNKGKLEETKFKQKFYSMYNGTKTKKIGAITYTAAFCLRRLSLVCILLALRNHNIWLINAYNALQSFYFWYMTSLLPHDASIHNRLEIFNELCVILMQYLMVFFISNGNVDPEVQWMIGTATMCLVAFVFAVNIAVLIHLTILKLIFTMRVRKARQAARKVQVRRNAIMPLDSAREQLNEARNLSLIKEEVEDEGSMVLASVAGSQNSSQVFSQKQSKSGLDEVRNILLTKKTSLSKVKNIKLMVEEDLNESGEAEDYVDMSMRLPTCAHQASATRQIDSTASGFYGSYQPRERVETRISLGRPMTELESNLHRQSRSPTSTNGIQHSFQSAKAVNFKTKDEAQEYHHDHSIVSSGAKIELNSSAQRAEFNVDMSSPSGKLDGSQESIGSQIREPQSENQIRSLPTQRVNQTDKIQVFSTVLESVMTSRPQYGNSRTRKDSCKRIKFSAEPRIERLQTKEDEGYFNRSSAGVNISAASNGHDGPRQIYYNKPSLQSLSQNRSNEKSSSQLQKSSSSRDRSEDSIAVEEAKNKHEPYLTNPQPLSSLTTQKKVKRTRTERDNSLFQFLQSGRMVLQNSLTKRQERNRMATQKTMPNGGVNTSRLRQDGGGGQNNYMGTSTDHSESHNSVTRPNPVSRHMSDTQVLPLRQVQQRAMLLEVPRELTIDQAEQVAMNDSQERGGYSHSVCQEESVQPVDVGDRGSKN